MLLKKINKTIFVLLILLCQRAISSEVDEIKNIINSEYFLKFSEFKSRFIQSDQETSEEGVIYIKNNRLRIDYEEGSGITIIVAKNKAMYFNKGLSEVEFFDPSNSVVEVFYDIFYKKNFFDNADFILDNKLIFIKKKINLNAEEFINLIVVFEQNPLSIKKIIIERVDYIVSYFLINPEFFLSADKDFFSMANPLLKN